MEHVPRRCVRQARPLRFSKSNGAPAKGPEYPWLCLPFRSTCCCPMPRELRFQGRTSAYPDRYHPAALFGPFSSKSHSAYPKAEISVGVRMLSHIFSYIIKTFIQSPVYVEDYLRQHMSCHHRMTVAVNEARQDHPSVQIIYLGILIAKASAPALSPTYTILFPSTATVSAHSLILVHSKYAAIHIKLICAHLLFLLHDVF